MNGNLFKAILSMDSYNRGYAPGIVTAGLSDAQGTKIGNAEVYKNKGDTEAQGASFYGIAYQIKDTNGNITDTVISYRGTDDPTGEYLFDGDIWNGWLVGGAFAGQTQAELAFKFYQSVAGAGVDPRTADISLTGHSLGGGLAGLVGVVYNADALAFDNMPFELAAEAIYWGSTPLLTAAYNTANPLGVLVTDEDMATVVYGSPNPWSLTDVPSDTIEAVALQGEVLTGLRDRQDTYVDTLTLGTEVDLGLSLTDLHSMSSLIIRMFADLNYGGEVTSAYWKNAAQYFWATLYDKGVGGFAEKLVEGTPDLTGRDIENKDYAGVLRQALAYSAIDEGTTIFGNTGIRAFYNDANNFGWALGYTTSSIALTAYADSISRVFVQYAGELALRKVNMNDWSDTALDGVLTYTNETNNHTLTVDLTQNTWARVGGGKFSPQDNIIGNYDLVEDVSLGYNKIYLDNYRSAMTSLWGSDSNILFDRIIFSVIDNGTTIINQTPASGRANMFVGGDGVDTVMGSDGNDLILGKQGNDTLDGGSGKDILAGGNGADTYTNVTSDDKIVEEAGDAGRDVIVADGATPDNTVGKQDSTGIWVSGDQSMGAGYAGPDFFIPNAVEGVVSNGTDYDAEQFVDHPLSEPGQLYDIGHNLTDPGTPLVLDLNGDGISVTDYTKNGSVYWDYNGDGFANKSGWITGGDGLLAFDRNGDGVIDNQRELFGNTGVQADAFKELAAFDTNNDGALNASDAQYADLRVWVDGNADAISQSDELHTLQGLGITSISLAAREVDIDIGLNNISAESTFVMNGVTRNISDVWFTYDTSDTKWNNVFVGDYVRDPRVDGLPDVRGAGSLPYLSVAMSKDQELLQMVQSYTQKNYGVFNFDSKESYNDVQQIIFKWAGRTPTENPSGIDFAYTMEKMFMQPFTGVIEKNGAFNWRIFNAWDYVVRYVQAQLLFQLESEPIFIQKPSYNSYYGVVEGSYSLDMTYISGEITKFAASDSNRVLAAAKIINFLDATVGLETLDSSAKADLAAVFDSTQSVFGLTYADFENSYRAYSVTAQTDQPDIFGKLYVGSSADDILPGVLDGKIILGAEGNDKISASGDGNILYGGFGNDEYVLSGGANTIVYESGVDRVTSSLGLETIRISDPAITAANVVLSRSGLYDLHVYINGNLSLQLVDQFKSGNGVETIRFSNGTSLDLTVLGNVTGTANGETLTGFDHVLLQDDVISDTGGNDTINGGAGADTLSYADAAALVNVDLTSTTAQITGGAGTDTISNIENVVGTKYADVLTGNAFDNWIEGGLGNDTLRGGAGVDTLSYVSVVSNTTTGVTVSLAVSTAQNTGVGSDTVSEFENLTGSAYNDTLTGDANANVINGGSGNDTIQGGLGNDTLIGNFGTDTLTYAAATSGITVSLASAAAQNTGGAGTDTVSGFENLTGSGYDDALTGDAGANVISGGAGNDTIQGYLGDDTLKGETGTDTLTYAGATAGVVVSLALTTKQNTIGAGADTISGFENLTGSGYDDTLTGDIYVNVINGGSGNDTIKGVSGNDTLNGGAGNDLIESGSGNDTLTGDTGIDTLSYASSASKVTISLAITAAQYAGAAGTDTISGFENLTGSAYNDTLTGDTGNNTIDGGAGDDTITGDLGNDTLGGGSGVDTLTYAAATSAITASLLLTTAQVTGGSGSDTILNIENLIGSAYNDVLTGDTNNNRIEGGSGNDTLSGGAGNDTASYRSATAAVTVSLATGPVQATGGAGTDTLTGFENLIGSNYSDTLTGDDGDNVIEGGVGADILNGGVGNDTVSYAGALGYVMVDLTRATEQNTGGAGPDTLSGFENIIGSAYDDDYLTGDANDNIIDGGAGRDVIHGGAGVDTVTYATHSSGVQVGLIADGGGDDQLFDVENIIGSAYNDLFAGDAGNNVLKGEAGIDTISYSAAASGVTLSLLVTSAQNTGGAGTDTVSGFENITGSAYNDVLTGDTGNNTIEGLGGNDTIYGGAGNDTIYGGGGADIVYGGDGNDHIYELGDGSIVDGGLGDDELFADAGTNATVSYASATSAVRVTLGGTGSSAQDTIGAGIDKLSGFLNLTGSGYNDVLKGDSKNNTIEGGAGNDIIDGFTGIDTASYKTAASAVSVSLAIATAQNTGGAGYDTLSSFENLTGSDYNDTLTGDFRSNILEGGLGNDILDGADGSDTASYSAAGAAVSVSLAVTTAQNTGGAGTDTLSYIENLVGSLYNDTLTGDAGNNILEGGAGDDVMDGGSGSDTASYGTAAAAVTVSLSSGPVKITGGAGTDTLSDIENLVGSTYNDTLTGDAGSNIIEGGSGNDIMDGAAGTDTASYSTAISLVKVNLALTTAQITGGAGTDTLSGFENLIGSAFGDTLTGDAGNNVIEGGLGNDILKGEAGTDTVSYSTAGSSGVTVSLAITSAQNTVGAGSDTLTGFENIIGSSYDDVLSGSSGDNILDGGAGVDTVSYSAATSAVTVSLAIGGSQNTIGAGSDTLTGFENLTGSSYNDSLTGDTSANRIDGGSGNDTIGSGDGDDTVIGGAGTDILDGGTGNDTASYVNSTSAVTVSLGFAIAQDTIGAGSDTLSGFENLMGSNFSDTLTGDSNNNVIDGGVGGNDILDGGAGIDTVSYYGTTIPSYGSYSSNNAVTVSLALTTSQSTLGAGYDTLSGFENLRGTRGNDNLTGDANANVIEGMEGNDVIAGAGGDDTLSGAEGDDTYMYVSGVNTILETGAGLDKVVFDVSLSIDDARINGNVLSFVNSQNSITFSDIALIEKFSFSGKSDMTLVELQAYLAALEQGSFVATVAAESFVGTGSDDTVDYSASTEAVTVDLRNNAASGGYAQGDSFTSIENLTGSSYGDILGGSAGNNIIDGGAGLDTVVLGGLVEGYGFTGMGDFIRVSDTVGTDGVDDLYGVEYVRFANGLTLDLATFSEWVLGTSGKDALYGNDNANVIIAGGVIAGEEDQVYGYKGDDILVGGSGTHVLRGDDGNDIEYGGADNDTLHGNRGNDTLYGESGNDEIHGEEDDDTLYGGSGVDKIRGEGGNDIIYAGQGADIEVYGDDGNDIIHGNEDADILHANEGKDTLYGDEANDKLYGEQDDDILYGGIGVDELYGDGSDSQTSFIGNDTLYGEDGDDTLRGSRGNDRLYGGVGNDKLLGGEDNDVLDGGDGDDKLRGEAGNDTYVLSKGADDIQDDSGTADVLKLTDGKTLEDLTFSVAANGNDLLITIAGETSSTTITSQNSASNAKIEFIELEDGFRFDFKRFANWNRGSVGDDDRNGTAGDDIIVGFGGDDSLLGAAGNDFLLTGSGADTLVGGDGNDELYSGDGNDTLYGGSGDDLLYGSLGNDTYFYTSGTDTLEDTGGADTIGMADGISIEDVTFTINNNNLVIGLAGSVADTIVLTNHMLGGASAIETLHFEDGTSFDLSTYGSWKKASYLGGVLNGTAAADFMLGAAADDTMYGDAGNDDIYGMAGKDRLYGGYGSDIIHGGSGDDALYTYSDTGSDTSNDIAYGDDGDDKIYGNNGNDTLYGGSGIDVLKGGLGTDSLYGDAGNDELRGEDGTDQLFGGDGVDKLIAGAGDDAVYGGYDDDSVYAGDGNDTIYGESGKDTLRGENGNDYIDGGAGDDIIYGDDNGGTVVDPDTGLPVPTPDGDDSIIGGSGNDTIYAEGGNDVIDGGNGLDYFYGGTGSDLFRFTADLLEDSKIDDLDRIKDWGTGGAADKMTIEGLLIGYDSVTSAISDFVHSTYNGSTTISVDRDGAGTTHVFTDMVVIEGKNLNIATLIENNQLEVI